MFFFPQIIEKIFSFLDVKNVLIASLACKEWLRASQCLKVSKRICLKLNNPKILLDFRHRRFCCVKVENIDRKHTSHKLSIFWKNHKQNIREIEFENVHIFSVISSALTILHKLESVHVINCRMFQNFKEEKSLAKCVGNTNITSLVSVGNRFCMYHVAYLLLLTPNITSIEWINRSRIQTMLHDFLRENFHRLKNGIEFLKEIQFVTICSWPYGTVETLSCQINI